MKLKKLASALATAALAAVASVPAHAGYVVLDGWELVTPTTDTKSIGRLNLVSGTATVEQEVNGLGNAFVGAKFKESGSIFSLTYTKENVVGAGDSGSPSILGDFLTIAFSGVEGKVTALNSGGGFHYEFTSGTFTLQGSAGLYAGGTIVGIGGNTAATAIIGGITGDSTLLATVLATFNASFDIKDNLGVSLLPAMATGNVLFEATTNNNVTDVTPNQTCSFTTAVAGNKCLIASVASAGDAYLVTNVPEPGSLALAGLALFGVAGIGRRMSKKA